MIALTMTTNLPASPNKSCFTCKNLKTWDYPGTLEDPKDSGWECRLLFNEHYISDEVADACKSEEELAIAVARDCPLYAYDANVANIGNEIEPEYAFPDVDPKLCPDAIPYASYYF